MCWKLVFVFMCMVFLLMCVSGEDKSTETISKHHLSYFNISKTLSSPHHLVPHNITGVKTITYFHPYFITHTITSATAGQPIKLTLEYLDVPRGCDDDSLEIWEGLKLIFHGCNQTQHRTFQSSGSEVRVIFKSNGDHNDYNVGFLLHYESVLASTVKTRGVVQRSAAALVSKSWLLMLCSVVHAWCTN